MCLKRCFMLTAILAGLLLVPKTGAADPGWRVVWSEWCFMEAVQKAQGTAMLDDYARPVSVSCFSASQTGIGRDRTFSLWSDSWLVSAFLQLDEYGRGERGRIAGPFVGLQLFARALDRALNGEYGKHRPNDRPGWGDCATRSPAAAGCSSDNGPAPVPTHTTPEPATMALLGTGLAGVVSIKRRRWAK